ncbi:cytochrome P450 [Tanacetum coccineum]
MLYTPVVTYEDIENKMDFFSQESKEREEGGNNGWTWVIGKRNRHLRSTHKTIKETNPVYNKTSHNTITFHFTNFPTNWDHVVMKDILAKYGKVVDVYIAGKRNMHGKRFGFAKFEDIHNATTFVLVSVPIILSYTADVLWVSMLENRVIRREGDVWNNSGIRAKGMIKGTIKAHGSNIDPIMEKRIKRVQSERNEDGLNDQYQIEVNGKMVSLKVQTIEEFIQFMKLMNTDNISYKHKEVFTRKFNDTLKWFHKTKAGKDLEGKLPPKISNVEICLFDFYKFVNNCEAMEKITIPRSEWMEIAMYYGFPNYCDEDLKKTFEDYLLLPHTYYELAKGRMPNKYTEGMGTLEDQAKGFADHFSTTVAESSNQKRMGRMEQQLQLQPLRHIIKLKPTTITPPPQLTSKSVIAELKTVVGATNTHNLILDEGFEDFSIKYLGGLYLLINLPDETLTRKFLVNNNLLTHFKSLNPWTDNICITERVTWPAISGLPPKLWTPDTFHSIASS